MVDPNSTKGRFQVLDGTNFIQPGNLELLALPEVPHLETAWLIESENGMYLGESTARGLPRLGFVSGHDKALRFARKEDAEAVLRMFPAYGLALHERAIGVTEHEWVGASPHAA